MNIMDFFLASGFKDTEKDLVLVFLIFTFIIAIVAYNTVALLL